jgi:hypothetical protein
MVMVPVLLPMVVGVKVTFNVHEPLASKLAPQLSETAKSPLAVMLEILRVASPLFVSAML